MELNAQIWRNMAEIADNETLMRQLAKYLKKLVAKKDDPTLRGEYTTQLPGESLSDMLKRCGYAI